MCCAGARISHRAGQPAAGDSRCAAPVRASHIAPAARCGRFEMCCAGARISPCWQSDAGDSRCAAPVRDLAPRSQMRAIRDVLRRCTHLTSWPARISRPSGDSLGRGSANCVRPLCHDGRHGDRAGPRGRGAGRCRAWLLATRRPVAEPSPPPCPHRSSPRCPPTSSPAPSRSPLRRPASARAHERDQAVRAAVEQVVTMGREQLGAQATRRRRGARRAP